MNQAYQGHLADGSSVQKHSAGPVYPYIVFNREGDDEDNLRWCVMGPGFEGELRFASSTAAFGAAQRLKAVSENDDAWAFELEQLCMVALQRQEAMIGAANNLRPQRWQDMSKVQRVASLLNLGQIRNTLRLPMIQPPLFAAYARALHD